MKGAKSVNLSEKNFKSLEKLKRLGAIKTYSEFINSSIEKEITTNEKYYEVVKDIFEKYDGVTNE